MPLPALSRPRPTDVADLFHELARLRERLASLGETGGPGRWRPAADLEETDDAWTVELELPGVQEDDVDVELEDRVLTVAGEVADKERTGILRRRARRVGSFRYVVTLPGDVDADAVAARLGDGVLTVRVPKSPDTTRRHIRIAG